MKVLLCLFFLLILSFPAQAQLSYECGAPNNPMLERVDDPEFWRYCDIYARRFAYAAEQRRFRQQLEARRENYIAYRQSAVRDYEAARELYYELLQ